MPICKYEEFLSLIKYKNRILGIDHGTKNIGVAISDENLILSLPLTTIRRTKQKFDFEELQKLIIKNNIKGLVFGYPLNLDGTKGPRCQSVETFVKNFISFYDLPIFYQDERMSTQAIEKIFLQQNLSRKKRAKNIDEHAACWILQSALDSFKKK
tara:strand:+ start:516 stop:980 length:465 start_codon:yes stop_codon:yes gene_type:complete